MWVGCFLIGWCLLLLVPKASSGRGTTFHIKAKFIKRCVDYFQPGGKQSKFKLNPPSVTECTEIWSKFSNAWIGKNPDNAPNYDTFFAAAKQPDIKKIILWSGTYDFAHNLSSSGSCYVTLEDTFIGHLVNKLDWCGTVGSSGINYHSCPDDSKKSFWDGASKTFAESLQESGSVLLILNGSRQPRSAFELSSVASMYELPNLPKSAKIRTILVHDREGTQKETCDTGSLVTLKQKLVGLSFTFECIETPPDLAALFKKKFPLKYECEVNSATTRVTSILKYVCPFIVFVFFSSL